MSHELAGIVEGDGQRASARVAAARAIPDSGLRLRELGWRSASAKWRHWTAMLALCGCGSLRVEVTLKQPDELMATARVPLATAWPSVAAMPSGTSVASPAAPPTDLRATAAGRAHPGATGLSDTHVATGTLPAG